MMATAMLAPVVGPVVSPASHIAYATNNAELEMLNEEIKELIEIANKVMKTEEWKNVYVEQRYWLSTPGSRSGMKLNSKNPDEKRAYIERIRAELNRGKVREIVDSLGVTLPANFDVYYEEPYHTEIKDLVIIAQRVYKHPDFNKLSDISQRWIRYYKSQAESSADRLDDEENTNYHINNLKMALNRGGAIDIVSKSGYPITDRITTYTEPEVTRDLRDMVEIASMVQKLPEYKNLPYDNRTWINQANGKAKDQSFGEDTEKQAKALKDLKAELNRSDVKPLFDKASAKFYGKQEPAADNELVANLKKAIAANQGQVTSAEFLLNELPKTVRGKEDKLITKMKKAHDLQVESAALVAELTGEQITIAPLRIPAKYK